jgi:hypothetical protein
MLRLAAPQCGEAQFVRPYFFGQAFFAVFC